MNPDELEFRKAIVADPADDTARLVYADWLQDHGREERAEFIRLQISASRAGAAGADLLTLFERERELLGVAAVEDWAEIPADWNVTLWRFVRGFVGELRMPHSDWYHRGDLIQTMHPIQHVVLLTDPGEIPEVMIGSLPPVAHYRIAGRVVKVPMETGTPEILAARWPGITFEVRSPYITTVEPPEAGDVLGGPTSYNYAAAYQAGRQAALRREQAVADAFIEREQGFWRGAEFDVAVDVTPDTNPDDFQAALGCVNSAPFQRLGPRVLRLIRIDLDSEDDTLDAVRRDASRERSIYQRRVVQIRLTFIRAGLDTAHLREFDFNRLIPAG